MKISAVIPAFNEAENIALVVEGLRALRDKGGAALIHEVIVADNNSTDRTSMAASDAGAIVIFVEKKGYGNACFEACKQASGDVLLFVDGDHTADLSQIANLINALDQGADLSIGARENATPGSLTTAQKFGNAFACFLIRFIWRVPVTDLGPLRAIRRSAYEQIAMKDRSFGWTIEMQIRAIQLNLPITETPVTWFPRHAGKSKVSGTVLGVIGAGWGILSMIAKLKWLELAPLYTKGATASKAASVASSTQSFPRSVVRTFKTKPKEN